MRNGQWARRPAGSLRVAFLLGTLVGLAAPAAAQVRYTVEDLGALPGDGSSVAWAINQRGDVVGHSTGPAGTRAFLFTDERGMIPLPGLPGRPRALARDINDEGTIVGTANAGGVDIGHAVMWSHEVPVDLGTLGTGACSEAWAINNRGKVVGYSCTSAGSSYHAFLYTRRRGMRDLTPTRDTGFATDINDASQVTGYRTAAGGYHAFRWQAGKSIDLGVLPGFAHSFGGAINVWGQVAGSSSSASGNSERFMLYTNGVGLENLGGTGEHNVAFGINEAGHMVGTAGASGKRAVLYTDEAGLRDLNTLIDPALGWVLLAANDINDAGEIVGYGFNNLTQETHAVRLIPTGAP